jgi:hypothetical protein
MGGESKGEREEEEEHDEEEEVDAEGHQLGQHAQAPGDSFEGRIEAGTDAMALPRRARPPPGSYADTACELETDDEYEEEKEIEEAGVGPALKKRGGPCHAGSARLKGVTLDKSSRNSRQQYKGKHMGAHTTEEAAAHAYNKYLEDSSVPKLAERGPAGTSEFKGVSWDKNSNRWRVMCNGIHLGYHATEEDAARAYRKYLEDGIDPVKRREAITSQFTGVCWDKNADKWRASCRRTYLGSHVSETSAARAYNVEAKRVGRCLNVIPPAGAAGAGAGTGAGAGPGPGAGAGLKHAAPKAPAAPATTPATPATSKKMKL